MYAELHTYKTRHPANSIDISDKGLIALGTNRTVQVLQHAFTNPTDAIYLTHEIRTPNRNLASGSTVVCTTTAV